ncbi:putative alpha-1,3-mannosyltransferase [Phytophthora cinnamomi]|uniref:putative alpha-1,3-mannosyltransferase n=1 Tax=Phytophthora cinnamomi TaxID=4785 RepID=UPI003559794C|nr:putative alpha-1,3-mannosyltransferase [Phytophthora cinnamomi]
MGLEDASRGALWAAAFGLRGDVRVAQRERYERLKQHLVFQIDSAGATDPLSAIAAASSSSSGSDSHGWGQYFTDEGLLEEINTDLDRLFPAGNEGFFQNELYLGTLRHVLFVWCRLHPDVAYRQGMHDVVAVVLYALLQPQEQQEAEVSEVKTLWQHAEADTFLVFEAVMLFLKPFYEIVKTRPDVVTGTATRDGSRLFDNFTLKENGAGNAAYGLQTKDGGKQPALHRLCHHVQYELLQQKDPQLYYHLQNLEIVPETYCLRWIRLLFAREYALKELLCVWDAMILDANRATIDFPKINMTDKSDNDLLQLPKLITNNEDASWVGFPLLRYICVARLLQMSSQLRQSDNTGCLRLLMRAYQEEEASGTGVEGKPRALELTRFAKILQDPLIEENQRIQSGVASSVNGEVNPNGKSDEVEVVQFQEGSLGIILTAAGAPFEDRLAVKSFTKDPTRSDGVGQAEASGKVHLGDLLQSINGVPIVGVTTEEVKRRLQLIDRPIYMGFCHCSDAYGDVDAATSDVSEAFDASNSANSSLTSDAALAELVQPVFLPGELCYANVETSMQQLVLSHDGSCLSHYISGKLFITNYRCFFTRLLGRGEIGWQIPVLSIASIDRVDPRAIPSGSGPAGLSLDNVQVALGFAPDDSYKVVIRCKDTQVARLSIADNGEYSKLVKCLSFLAFPKSLLDAFCFAYSPTVAPSEEVQFDIRQEYGRIGLLSLPDHLRCIDQSPKYTLCDTYPRHIIVPADISDVRLKAAAAFRSHQRLPVVSWIHRSNGATIVRSSQPLVGFKSARSGEDELLVQLLCCSSNKKAFGRYVIMDARSQLAAVGNKAMGKGTEISSNYRGAKLIFMNVENIHSVRQSQLALAAIFEPRKSASEDTSSSFYGRIDSSGWLRHVRLVLKASVELAHTVNNGVSVLTHCSDGWDRTAQMVALAELMLDPYYRTLRGFQVLVEKEWCSFGHQFALRSGHARSDVSNEQRSPVFLLWLDCVWQYIRQYPTECEFNESFLLTLADHVYSCKFGTFMFDCERQRKDFFAKHRVFSIWSEINSQSERFTNHMYAPSEQATVLSPSTLSKNIKLWKGYFCRWDPTVIPPVPAGTRIIMALPPPPALAAVAAPWVLMFIFVVWAFVRGLSCSVPRVARVSGETRGLRVGFLHPDFGIGGAENLVVNAAVALQQRGAHVTVFTAHHDVSHCFEETRGDGPLAKHVRVHGDWLPRTILGKLYAFCAVVRVLFVTLCVALYYINDLDVFVVDQVSISIPFLRALGKPVLFYGHFPDKLLCIRSDSPWKRLYRVPLDFLEEITTAASDIIVANSKFSRGVFQEVFPRLQSKKLGVLYPPVDVKAYKATAKAEVERDSGLFVSLNRFERKKNVALAIEALVELRNRLPSEEFQRVKLIVAGGYDPLNTENKEHLIELQDVVAKHGLGEHVEFRTSVSNSMKLELLRKAHAILYTPDREHFGIVPVEAMACGTPVVAVSSGGPLESIADGETGFLCQQKPEAFAEAMAELCGPKNSVRVVEMGACGRLRAQKLFSLETFGDTLLELVNEAVYGEKVA